MSERPLSPEEVQTLSAYLPEDLTTPQLAKVLRATRYACEKAFEDGARAQGTIIALYHKSYDVEVVNNE